MIQDGKILVKNKNGEEKTFSILSTFELEEKNKNYILYTDYSKTEQGDINIYSSIYDDNGKLQEIMESDEIEVVQNYIKKLEKDLKQGIELY